MDIRRGTGTPPKPARHFPQYGNFGGLIGKRAPQPV